MFELSGNGDSDSDSWWRRHAYISHRTIINDIPTQGVILLMCGERRTSTTVSIYPHPPPWAKSGVIVYWSWYVECSASVRRL